MQLGKKGIVMTTLATIIISIVGFALIVASVANAQQRADDRKSDNICQASLVVKSRAQSIGRKVVVFDTDTPIVCKTKDVVVDVAEKDEATTMFAKHVERCWWIWLEGTVDQIFGAKGFFGTDSKPQCFVCYAMHYKSGERFTKFDLMDKLSSDKTKYRKSNSILDYVQERGYVEPLESEFVPGEYYAIIFAGNLGVNWIDSFKSVFTDLPSYDSNGVWIANIDKFKGDNKCYLNSDVMEGG